MIDLNALRDAAARQADAAEALLKKEEAAVGEDIKFAVENHQSISGHHWQRAHTARLKADTARALVGAIDDVRKEFATGE